MPKCIEELRPLRKLKSIYCCYYLNCFNFRDTIGPQIPGQAYPSAYPQPPMYYPNRTLVNQVPGMYNPGMPGMPMPQPPVGPPPMPMTPAVRKADELGPGAEKKPRTEEPEWPLTDPVSILYIISNLSKNLQYKFRMLSLLLFKHLLYQISLNGILQVHLSLSPVYYPIHLYLR